MFIGDQYPYVWGPCPYFSPPLHSSLSNSEDRPCSRGRDMECRSGSPGPPPWAPGAGLRGLKSQFSARVGDSHSFTHTLVFVPPWSLPLILSVVPNAYPGPCFIPNPPAFLLSCSHPLESSIEFWVAYTFLGYTSDTHLLHLIPFLTLCYP